MSGELRWKRWDGDFDEWQRMLMDTINPHVFQSALLAEVRSAAGQKVERLVLEEDGVLLAMGMALRKNTPIGPIYYLPRGPCFTSEGFEDGRATRDAGKLARKLPSAVMIHTPDLGVEYNARWLHDSLLAGGAPLPEPMLFNATRRMDLTLGTDFLLKNCRKGTRYDIRRARRDGAHVERLALPDALEPFYSLLSETQGRRRFHIPDRSYFEALLGHPRASENVRIYGCRKDGDYISFAAILTLGKNATYSYGASNTAEKDNQSKSKLLQWAVIEDLVAEGFMTYDFQGHAYPPPPKGDELFGLYHFKKSFGAPEVWVGTEVIFGYASSLLRLQPKLLKWLSMGRTRLKMLGRRNQDR